MTLVKCPRCELNYMHEGEKLCPVCRREMRGESDLHDMELCTACGERPAAQGEELCIVCLREIHRTEGFRSKREGEADAEAIIDPLTPSDIEEMELEIEEDIPSSELGEIDRELGAEEEEIIPESLEQLEEAELNDLDEEEEDV